MDDKIQDSAERIKESARTVEHAVETVQEAAASVESNVAEGIQPDLRELRSYIRDLDAKANIRLKRMFWGLIALAVLNLVILAVLLAG